MSVPDHPERTARVNPRRRDADDLTPAELAWLQRLPTDPAAVTFDDATELASLAASITTAKAPSSARLIASIWEPVKQIHDRNVANAQLELAKQSPDPLPAAASRAVFEAVERQYADLGEGAIASQASDEVTRLKHTLEERHSTALSAAQRHVEEVESAIATRAETRREVQA